MTRLDQSHLALKNKTHIILRARILTKAIMEQRKLRQHREYNRRVIKFFIDLDYIKYDGFPRITQWPRHATNLTLPYILKFFRIKDGAEHEMYPPVTFQKMKTQSWW